MILVGSPSSRPGAATGIERATRRRGLFLGFELGLVPQLVVKHLAPLGESQRVIGFGVEVVIELQAVEGIERRYGLALRSIA
jgi:hypothetical protein